ncbi:Ribosomal protein S9,Ribosomal protein S5 domain 2-type fold,Ribosomal protein S5 domain 2-type fold [Cinara cedri]|uniref:Small ribosomal subunit protein uS9m n=1 Tax=Cinara cedri TaxID=506608 RepID=A0A5E4MKI0_9HEMI|nr:Ribosomal protein S9,Ribosomal protein S5 domain 2-type fold,Ribosomal protein S5 domain 2-type fold [Cinara cedri]
MMSITRLFASLVTKKLNILKLTSNYVPRCTYGLNNVGSNDPGIEIEEKKIVEEKTSLAMRAYLQRATLYNNFMEQQTHEFQVGKRHLANMMGVDPETFTQKDINEAIEYLFPSGLYDPKARPFMKPPSEVFPPKKDAEFDESGRPFHVFFYTGKPNFYLILHNIATKLSELNKFEDSLRKNNILPDDNKKLSSIGSQWLSKEDVEKLTVEKLSDYEYKHFTIAIERLLKHPCSYKYVEFIAQYQKPMITTKAIMESSPVEYTKDGKAYVTVKDCPRKSARADVTVFYPGTGKLSINGKGIEFFDDIQAREQILFPLLFTDMVEKVDIEATVRGGGISGKAGAIRFGISWSLRSFVEPETVERMRIAGLLQKDYRRRERKKPGQARARRKFTWKKR